ncbi:MAG TPA: hypothetical protein VGN34_02480, partial [Ktedonobacteraceae bacterium]
LGRLHQLLQGIRNGIDEESVIAEDDADYARYRTMVEAVGATSPDAQELESASAVDVTDESQKQMAPVVKPSPVEIPLPSPSAVPSFDEVLASFRTPSVNPGEEVLWPEDPVARLENVASSQSEAEMSQSDAAVSSAGLLADEVLASFRTPSVNPGEEAAWPEASIAQLETQSETSQSDAPSSPVNRAHSDGAQNLLTDAVQAGPNLPTALEELMASTRPVPPVTSVASEPPSAVADLPVVPSTPRESNLSAYLEMHHQQPVEHSLASHIIGEEQSQLEQDEVALPQIYDQMQKGAQAVVSQTSSLTGVVAQLRQAMAVIEGQRSEFKGFLSGSKDALERMEDWAGQAMGLNLRNSPEQVRRYLPLSVMWVANSKLKKVLDLLGKIASGVEMTDEQIASNLHQLYTSIQSFGQVFQQWEEERSSHVLRQEPGWSPWEMQATHDPEDLRERVTFERQGDLAALRSELETNIRKELQHEYEARYVSPMVRVELEQQIRQEVRQEFEDRLRLQQTASLGKDRDEDIQNLKA